MKAQIISEIRNKMEALGIVAHEGNDADFTINTEFLDAGWSTGSKKISYEASVFANEQDNTVYMYEKTTEVGHGLSFGGENSSSFQSGKTLFRKVKSVQYGPDGKAYEYTLNLGAIPKTVKEIAKAHGWNFKTVLNKKKAVYPAGYAPETKPLEPPPQVVPDRTQDQQQSKPQFDHSQGAFHAQGKAPAPKNKAETLGLITLIILGAITVIMFALMSVNMVGWIIGALILAGFGFVQRKLASKGCLLSVVLWVAAVVLLLLTMTFTMTTGADESSAGDSLLSARLPYEKAFTLDDGKSTGVFKLFVSDGTGFYENYEGKVICEFYVKFDTTSLPADFKMRDEQATEQNAMGSPALDGLVMAVCSETEAYHISSLSYAQAIYNGGNIKPFLETEGATTNMSAACLKEMAEQYPLIQVLRYNDYEVGMTQDGDTWTTNTDNAFGLHPPVTEGYIPWDDILNDLGIK
ncbi:MAG: hypothetical protein AB1767_00175 [Bacillota bacterium]